MYSKERERQHEDSILHLLYINIKQIAFSLFFIIKKQYCGGYNELNSHYIDFQI